MFHRLAIRRFGLVLLTTLALNFIALQAAHAATYYVSVNGGSDSNSGSEAAPFRTVQKAVGVVKPGDTVIIKPGRHNTFMLKNINGAAGAPITFKGEPGAIIDRALGPDWRPIEIWGGSYITIDGLELTNSGPLPGYADCSNRISTGRAGSNGIKMYPSGGTSGTSPHHLIFSNLHIHHNSSQGIFGRAEDSQFLNNHVHDNGSRLANEQAYGTYLMGARWLIRGNRFYNNNGNGIRLGSDSGRGAIIFDSIIENNVIYNNGGQFTHPSGPTGCRLITAGDGIVIWHGSGNIVRNNIVYNNVGNGIRINEDFGVNNKHNLVYTNTVYGNKMGGLVTYYPRDKTIFKNNISYLNSGQNIASIGGVLSNNLTTDPEFVNASGGDFHLQAGSPAIDAGQTLAEVTNDFAYGVRPWPAGGAYDIGAYEFGSPPGSGPSPPPPSGVPPAVPRPPSTYDPTKSLCPI